MLVLHKYSGNFCLGWMFSGVQITRDKTLVSVRLVLRCAPCVSVGVPCLELRRTITVDIYLDAYMYVNTYVFISMKSWRRKVKIYWQDVKQSQIRYAILFDTIIYSEFLDVKVYLCLFKIIRIILKIILHIFTRTPNIQIIYSKNILTRTIEI